MSETIQQNPKVLQSTVPPPPPQNHAELTPKPFLREVLSLAGDNIKGVLGYFQSPKSLIIYAVYLVLWTVLPIIPLQSFMVNIPEPIKSLCSLAIFLTAAYSTVLGKVAYLVSLFAVVIPLFRAIRSGKTKEYFGIYKRSYREFKDSFTKLGKRALPILIIGAGLGLAVANVLSRNNKIDKYLPALLLGASVLGTLGHVIKPRLYDLLRSAVADLLSLFKVNIYQDHFAKLNTYTHVGIVGLGVGLVGSIIGAVFNLTNSYGDYSCYLYGGIVLVVGVVLVIVLRKKHDQSNV